MQPMVPAAPFPHPASSKQTMHVLIDLFSLLLSGLLVGNELAVALFIHPVLYHVDESSHATVVRPLAAKLGRWMPFWYALSLLLVIAQLLVSSSRSLAWHLTCSAAALLALIIVLTIVFPVPINNRIAQLDLQHLPANWLSLRRRWDLYHQIRVLLLVIVFVLLITADLLH